MNSVLFDFRTAKEEWFDLAVKQYTKKINYFSPFQVVSLKTLSGQRDGRQQKIKFEQDQFEKKITADDYFILFDETGKNLSSESFSAELVKIQDQGKKRVVYLIGGAYGVSDEVKKKAKLKIALSSFVLNHLVAEVVVLEQIYRAYTIKNRIPYHNA
jgi:23S rRNA (pseudouridine1915-N3)-methyltransferase